MLWAWVVWRDPRFWKGCPGAGPVSDTRNRLQQTALSKPPVFSIDASSNRFGPVTTTDANTVTTTDANTVTTTDANTVTTTDATTVSTTNSTRTSETPKLSKPTQPKNQLRSATTTSSQQENTAPRAAGKFKRISDNSERLPREEPQTKPTNPQPTVKRTQPKLLLITFTFGVKAANSPHIPFFLESAKYCGADILVIGDKPGYRFPTDGTSKFLHIQKSWAEMVSLVEKKIFRGKLLPNLRASTAYKSIDLKPTLGVLFPEQLAPYKFWGHVDNDLILGNVQKFIATFDAKYADVVSIYGSLTAGPLTFYRNSAEMNHMFMKAPDLARVLDNEHPLNFDEWGNNNGLGREHSMTGILEKEVHLRRQRLKEAVYRARTDPERYSMEKMRQPSFKNIRFGRGTMGNLWDGNCNHVQNEVAQAGLFKPSSGLPCLCQFRLEPTQDGNYISTVELVKKTTPTHERGDQGQTMFKIKKVEELVLCHFEYGKNAATKSLKSEADAKTKALIQKYNRGDMLYWGRFSGIGDNPNDTPLLARPTVNFFVLLFGVQLEEDKTIIRLMSKSFADAGTNSVTFIGGNDDVAWIRGESHFSSEHVKVFEIEWPDFTAVAAELLLSIVPTDGEKQDIKARLPDWPVEKQGDFKPLLGGMFPELARDSKFWGFLDNRIVLGNLDLYLNDENLKHFDVLSPTTRRGFSSRFTVFRNTPTVNGLWKLLSSDEVFSGRWFGTPRLTQFAVSGLAQAAHRFNTNPKRLVSLSTGFARPIDSFKPIKEGDACLLSNEKNRLVTIALPWQDLAYCSCPSGYFMEVVAAEQARTGLRCSPLQS